MSETNPQVEQTPTAEEAPAAPAEETPVAPAEEAPAAPAEETPTAPAEEAPTAPAEEAPTAPAEEAPAAPVVTEVVVNNIVPTVPIFPVVNNIRSRLNNANLFFNGYY